MVCYSHSSHGFLWILDSSGSFALGWVFAAIWDTCGKGNEKWKQLLKDVNDNCFHLYQYYKSC